MHRQGRRLSPNTREFLAEADREFALGHLRPAASYAGAALTRAPASPEAHAMIARLASHPDGGPDLFPLGDSLTLADVLGHAHASASLGDFDKGLLLLAKAQEFMPGTPWADVPWVADPATASEADPQVIANIAVDLLPIARDLDESSRLPALNPYLRLIRNAVGAHPGHAPLHGAAGYLFRRFDIAEAARYAERAEELAPVSASAVALALIYRDQGRADDAAHAMERAVERDNRNPERYADACDYLLQAGRLGEARTYARQGLDIHPGHACCEVSAAAAEFCQSRRSEHFDRLVRLTQSHPVDSHAYSHGVEVMQIAAKAMGSQTVTLQGSARQIRRQIKRELRKQR